MPVSLLDSQLADLEPPGPDEQVLQIDIGPSPSVQAATIVDKLALD
jgi:gluconokinase